MEEYSFRLARNYISFSRVSSDVADGPAETKQIDKKESAEAILSNNKGSIDYKRHRSFYVNKISKLEKEPKYLITLLFKQELNIEERLGIFEKLKLHLRRKYKSNYFISKLELNKHDQLHIHILTDFDDVDGLCKKWYKLNKSDNSILFDCLNKFEPLYLAKTDKIGKDLKLVELLGGKKLFTTTNNKNIHSQKVKELKINQVEKDKVISILIKRAEQAGTMTPKYRRMLEARYGLALQLPEEVMEEIRAVIDIP